MHKNRLLCVLLGLLLICIVAAQIYQKGPDGLRYHPGCFIYKATGLFCPGCGMTRASYACMHGNFAAAIRANLLGMILLPIAALAIAWEVFAWVRQKPTLHRIHLSRRIGLFVLVVIGTFTILRNVPIYPLTLLAPP
ncbi:MAG: DUF2752 domain-containing protein [Verrucomicrobia bacterium]|nr:MAG: DUF2752 domain-containing protein [Verrucomicrobiota bacterium]